MNRHLETGTSLTTVNAANDRADQATTLVRYDIIDVVKSSSAGVVMPVTAVLSSGYARPTRPASSSTNVLFPPGNDPMKLRQSV